MADLRLSIIMDLANKASAPLKRIMGSSAETARALRTAHDALKKLNTQQKALDGFDRQQSALRESSNRVKVLQQNMVVLRATQGATSEQLNAAQKALNRATSAYDQQRAATTKLRQQLTGLGITKVSEAQARVKQETAKATAEIQKQEAALRRLSKLRQQHGKEMMATGMLAASGVAGMAAGRNIARPVSAVVGAYATQETSTSQLRAAMMLADGSVSAQFRQINDLAQRLGDRLPGSTADFVDMMTTLRKQGISANSILGGTGEAAAYLGVQLQIPAQEAAEFAAKMQDATRTVERDMMGLMDVIQRTYYLGVDKSNMLAGFAKMSPVLSIIKREGLDGARALAPLLVMMDQTGMAGEAAGNAIRKVFDATLDAKRLGKANAAIKAAGIAEPLNFVDAKGQFAGMENLLAQIQKIKSITSDVQRKSVIKELFGDDAETLQVLTTLMDKDLAGYRQVQAKLDEQADLRQRVQAQLQTLTNLWDAATGSFENVKAALGETVSEDIRSLTAWLGEATTGLRAFIAEHPVLFSTVIKTVAVVAALTYGISALMLAVAGVLGPFFVMRFVLAKMGLQYLPLLKGAATMGANALLWLARVLLLVGRAMALTPIGRIATLIATAAFLIYRYWGPITSFFSKLWDGITTRAQHLWERFKTIGGQLMDGLVGGIMGGINAVRGAIGTAADSAIGWFREKLGIHSPSLVFMAAGQNLGEGAAIGIRQSTDLVRRASVGLAAAGALGMPAAGMADAGGLRIDQRPPLQAGTTSAPMVIQGDTITIQITAAPGADPQALARAISAELDRRERAKLARVRSTLGDIE